MTAPDLPVAVIGAGPLGMAPAAQLVARELTPIVFERGPSVGASLQAWSRVRVFSPWRYNNQAVAGALLEASGRCAADELAKTEGEVGCGCGQPSNAIPRLEHV